MPVDIDLSLVQPKRTMVEVDWQLWEKSTLNLHRGVIEWRVDQECPSVDELAARIRQGVRTEFRPGWFRGFAFGAILHVPRLTENLAALSDCIDRRNNSQGVWQWVVVQSEHDHAAMGIHTWQHGYLRPIYDQVMAQLAADDFDCRTMDVEMDRFMSVLRNSQKLSPSYWLTRMFR